MAKEIERKFLVRDGWQDAVDGPGIRMRQAYLSTDPRATVRVRIAGDRARLTVKGCNHGIVRDEWEYDIPVADAEAMVDRCSTAALSKTRYRAGRWEIDRFAGPLEGLSSKYFYIVRCHNGSGRNGLTSIPARHQTSPLRCP